MNPDITNAVGGLNKTISDYNLKNGSKLPTLNINADTPTPANVPPPTPTTGYTGLQGTVNATADAFTQNLADNASKTKTDYTTSLNDYIKSALSSPTKSALSADAYATGGVNTAESELNDINHQILADQRATDNQIRALKENPEGLFGTGLSQKIQEVQDKGTQRQADLSIIALARQGKYDLAKKVADQAVEAKFEAQKQKNDILKFAFEENKDLFTKAEQEQFQVAQADRNRTLDTEKAKEIARYNKVLEQNDPKYKLEVQKLRNEIDATGGVTINNPKYNAVVQTILGSGRFTKDQAAKIAASINTGENPLTVVKNQAKNIMGQTEATKLTSYEAADSAMIDLQSKLADYYAAGGDTGIFSGNFEKVINKLGSVTDPAKVALATQVAVSLQAYRNAISGTAYSNQEGQQIEAIFPGINKSNGLNKAVIEGRLAADKSLIDGIYATALGKNVYQGVIENSGGKGTQSNASFVEKTLKEARRDYQSVVSGAQDGEIPVIRNEDGTIGYINPGEFTATIYTRI